MRNISLNLMFDGTGYHGFQRQKNGITIQEAIEKAIKKITGESVVLIGCSRTDAGVHAKRYTALFCSDTKIGVFQLPKAINSALPEDIRIIAAKDMPEDFHPIASAIEKTYNYKIINSTWDDVFLRRYAWFYPGKLDIDRMKKAGEHFIGSHDFSAFMAAGGSAKTTVRTISSLDVSKSGHEIDITVTANGFLYNMVRIITGTLVYVGNGKIEPEDVPEIILSGDRVRAGVTAPPHGLTLLHTKYKGE